MSKLFPKLLVYQEKFLLFNKFFKQIMNTYNSFSIKRFFPSYSRISFKWPLITYTESSCRFLDKNHISEKTINQFIIRNDCHYLTADKNVVTNLKVLISFHSIYCMLRQQKIVHFP